MKSFLPLLFCFFALSNLDGQNLVPNGSFEEYSECPNNANEVDSCIGWHRIMDSPDYFNACAVYPVCIPDNFAGYQAAQYGNAYIGLLTYVWAYFWREIIGTQLLEPLVQGNLYSISVRVSRGNWTPMVYNCAASNKLGIRFTSSEYSFINPPPIDNFAQLSVDSIITDTVNWVLLHWDYIADSTYTHLYIGNFFDDNHTDTAVINAPLGQFGMAYYFIDSLNVICLSASCATDIYDTGINTTNVWYDAYNNNIQITSVEKNVQVLVCNVAGQIINASSIDGNSTINVSRWAKGIYYIETKTAKHTTVKKILVE